MTSAGPLGLLDRRLGGQVVAKLTDAPEDLAFVALGIRNEQLERVSADFVAVDVPETVRLQRRTEFGRELQQLVKLSRVMGRPPEHESGHAPQRGCRYRVGRNRRAAEVARGRCEDCLDLGPLDLALKTGMKCAPSQREDPALGVCISVDRVWYRDPDLGATVAEPTDPESLVVRSEQLARELEHELHGYTNRVVAHGLCDLPERVSDAACVLGCVAHYGTDVEPGHHPEDAYDCHPPACASVIWSVRLKRMVRSTNRRISQRPPARRRSPKARSRKRVRASPPLPWRGFQRPSPARASGASSCRRRLTARSSRDREGGPPGLRGSGTQGVSGDG